MYKKGFTLIELLVVLSIIGVLATITLSSFESIKNKTKDVKIKTIMREMKTQAELFHLDNGNYYGTKENGWGSAGIGACSGNYFRLFTSVFDRNTENSFGHMTISVHQISKSVAPRVFCAFGEKENDSWAFAAPLFNPSSGKTGWCVDSHGASKEVNLDFQTGNPAASLGGMNAVATCP